MVREKDKEVPCTREHMAVQITYAALYIFQGCGSYCEKAKTIGDF